MKYSPGHCCWFVLGSAHLMLFVCEDQVENPKLCKQGERRVQTALQLKEMFTKVFNIPWNMWLLIACQKWRLELESRNYRSDWVTLKSFLEGSWWKYGQMSWRYRALERNLSYLRTLARQWTALFYFYHFFSLWWGVWRIIFRTFYKCGKCCYMERSLVPL